MNSWPDPRHLFLLEAVIPDCLRSDPKSPDAITMLPPPPYAVLSFRAFGDNESVPDSLSHRDCESSRECVRGAF
jgi:hypothetical protein